MASTLVIAEHANNKITQGSLSSITAAKKIGGEVMFMNI
jgi:hypothetical protein